MDFCFIQWVTIDYSRYFNTQVTLELISRNPFKLGSFHLTFSYHSSLLSFLVQQDVLESFCSSQAPDQESGINHFSGSPGRPPSPPKPPPPEMVFRNQDLGTMCAH